MAGHHDTPKLPTNGIEFLQADHRKIAALFQHYQAAQDRQTRLDIADQVCAALERHAQLEETVFYPALAEAAEMGGLTLVEDARQDQQMIKDLITVLAEVHDTEFDTTFAELLHTVQRHVEDEEQELFPQAERLLADQLEDLMDEMVALQQPRTAATRR